MDTGVFERKMNKKLSEEIIDSTQYNLIIGAVLLWGFAINWLMVKFIPAEVIQSINFIIFLVGYFVSCFLGVYLFRNSTNPLVSFIGYNFVVVPFGLVINIVISGYDPSLVLDAMRITGFVTLVMMALGTAFPIFFLKRSLAH